MAIKTFVTGEVLTAADTNTYLANSGLVYVTSATVGTAVSSVTVSSAFSTTYDSYKILLSGITNSAGTDLRITFGSTVTGYYGAYTYVYSVSGASAVFGQNNTANLFIGGATTTDDQHASIEILNPFTAKRTSLNGLAFGNLYSFFYSGMLANTTSYTAFTIAPGTGTMTGGTITVYGYRKA